MGAIGGLKINPKVILYKLLYTLKASSEPEHDGKSDPKGQPATSMDINAKTTFEDDEKIDTKGTAANADISSSHSPLYSDFYIVYSTDGSIYHIIISYIVM